MKEYIKQGARILGNYGITLIIFAIFIYPFLTITGDSFNKLLPLYCVAVFLFVILLIYSDMKGIAKKEKRPQYDLHPYPLKGLIYGLISIIPLAIITGASALFHFQDKIVDHLKHVAVNVLLGPMYFVIRLLKESTFGYAAALLLIPLIAMLGYIAGYYGINITEKIIKKKPVQEKGFTKSPWNPTNKTTNTGKKKKKVNKTTGGN
jgi:hypothetical protein